MLAAPGDTTTSSMQSLTQTTRNMPRGASGSAATLIPTTPMLRHSLRPCAASQRGGTADRHPASVRDPGSSADGYVGNAWPANTSTRSSSHCRKGSSSECRLTPGCPDPRFDRFVITSQHPCTSREPSGNSGGDRLCRGDRVCGAMCHQRPGDPRGLVRQCDGDHLRPLAFE